MKRYDYQGEAVAVMSYTITLNKAGEKLETRIKSWRAVVHVDGEPRILKRNFDTVLDAHRYGQAYVRRLTR